MRTTRTTLAVLVDRPIDSFTHRERRGAAPARRAMVPRTIDTVSHRERRCAVPCKARDRGVLSEYGEEAERGRGGCIDVRMPRYLWDGPLECACIATVRIDSHFWRREGGSFPTADSCPRRLLLDRLLSCYLVLSCFAESVRKMLTQGRASPSTPRWCPSPLPGRSSTWRAPPLSSSRSLR